MLQTPVFSIYFIQSPDCGNIPAPVHGEVFYSNNRTTYQEEAAFTCDLGFYLSHDVTRTCEASGNWGGTTPDCIITGK